MISRRGRLAPPPGFRSISDVRVERVNISEKFKLFHMIQIFSNISYFSTNLNFVYLCLPFFKWRVYAQILCLFHCYVATCAFFASCVDLIKTFFWWPKKSIAQKGYFLARICDLSITSFSVVLWDDAFVISEFALIVFAQELFWCSKVNIFWNIFQLFYSANMEAQKPEIQSYILDQHFGKI